MGVARQEIALRRGYEAQFNAVENTIDAARKILINKYKVKKNFANDFIKVVMAQSEGRKGGALFKSNSEAANKLGMSEKIYLDMMNSIQGELSAIKSSQNLLTSKWEEHTKFCEDPWHNILWLSYEGKITERPEMISSGVTKDAMKTKVLDDNFLPE